MKSAHRVSVAILIWSVSFGATVLLSGCVGQSLDARSGSASGIVPQARNAQCTDSGTLSKRLQFADTDEARRRLKTSDDWSRQLSVFERSARRRALSPTSIEELLNYVSAQALDWTPDEQAYWTTLVDRLSAALTGFNLHFPDIALVKSTGYDEFGAAYARQDVIVLPRARIAISGDERRDFFLLAHELFHLLSWNDSVLRDELYALLGFRRFTGFDLPSELEERRLSNPSGHTYDHALAVETVTGTAKVVPMVRSAVSLAELTALPAEGPAFLSAIETLLVAVDAKTGEVIRDLGGALMTYRFEETDWPEQMRRNTSYIIHPDEVMADNFALLMERRSLNVPPTETPSGFAINDQGLLAAMEDIMRQGCDYQSRRNECVSWRYDSYWASTDPAFTSAFRCRKPSY